VAVGTSEEEASIYPVGACNFEFEERSKVWRQFANAHSNETQDLAILQN
jgi:hypothetical protein